METERRLLTDCGYSSGVVETLLASRKASTKRLYGSTWRKFAFWCNGKGARPLRAKVTHILEFLQDGLRLGLSTSTLRRQVAAIGSVLGAQGGGSLASHPHIKRFLRGVHLVNPPTVHRYPSWSLKTVLAALTKGCFEPLSSIALKLVTLKTLFLVAVTSARRVSEIGALSVSPALCQFHHDRVVLRPDPSFIPKINTVFHRAQDLVIPSFFPRPVHRLEKQWHNIDARRALRCYIDRTRPLRKTDYLFVHFRGRKTGQKASSTVLSCWLKELISLAYQEAGKRPPEGVTAHSIRGAATSAAYVGHSSLEEICKAATWSNPNTFITHYRIDQARAAEAAMGRRVLQTVLSE